MAIKGRTIAMGRIVKTFPNWTVRLSTIPRVSSNIVQKRIALRVFHEDTDCFGRARVIPEFGSTGPLGYFSACSSCNVSYLEELNEYLRQFLELATLGS
jgi:hypothetical protein